MQPNIFRTREEDVTSFFMSMIEMCPALTARLKPAKLTAPATGTGNYSYDCEQMIGDRYMLIGDASGFIDPVFSTGVYLAMQGAFLGADAVTVCLDDPAHAPRAMKHFEKEIRRGLARFSWFIYRITSPTIRNLFMAPRNCLRMEEAVVALLSGDIDAKSPIRFRLFLFKCLYYAQAIVAKSVGLFTRTTAAPQVSRS